MVQPKKILIVSGEPSGDLHASNLVKELKNLNPNLEFFGIGGNLSKKAGVRIIFDITMLALIGVVEVLKNISAVRKAYKAVLENIELKKPGLAILVDYPGFNLRLAKELKKHSIPVVYYISPQVWAWGMKRIKIIKECVKKIVVFFRFEEELYKKHGVAVEFVGHPLLDIVRTSLSKDAVIKKYGLSPEKATVALLPGSRTIEVKALLPTMLASGKKIAEKSDKVQFIIAKFEGLPMDLYADEISRSGLDAKVGVGDAYNIVSASDFAIVASGTATLETAIVGTPFAIIYKVNLMTYILYKIVSTTRFIGLVNIIAGREVVPELLQFAATPEKIAAKVTEFLEDPHKIERMRYELQAVKSLLGLPGANSRAARAIIPFIQ